MTADYKDTVISEFADSEARLLDRIADLVTERDSYRLLAQQLLHGLHDVTVDRDNFRTKYYQLLDHYRKAA